MILTSALSHPGSSTLYLLSNTTNHPSTTSESLELENDRLRTQLDLQYEEELSARERYIEILSAKLKEAEKTAERWRREAEKDKILLVNVRHVLEQECEHLEEVFRAERAARSASPLDRELFQKRTQELETITRERDQLLSDLEDEKQHSQRLAASLSAADTQQSISASAFATAKETIKTLQAKEMDHLRAREAAEEQLTCVRQESEARVSGLLKEMAGLRSKHEQEVEVMKRNIETLEYEREQAERRSFDSGAAQSRLEALEKESEQARRRVLELERGSGNKELEITRLKRKLQEIEADQDGLNIALDLKQQELEILKRKFQVRGTAGRTPLPTRQGIMPRTLSVPSAASIASSSVTDSLNGNPVNIPSRRFVSVSGMPAIRSTTHARIVPRPSNPMEIFKHPNSSSSLGSHSTLEDDMAATPRAGTRDEENRRPLLIPP